MSMRKKSLLILLLFNLFFTFNFSETGTKDGAQLKLPDLTLFTGEFEYYSGGHYETLSITIKDRKLMLVESRSEPIILEQLNTDSHRDFLFRGIKGGKDFTLAFTKTENDKIEGFEFIGSSVTIRISRKPDSYLKKKYTVEELKEDFIQFRGLILQKAVSPYEFISREEFNQLIDEAYNSIKEPLSLRDFYTILLPLKEKIGCGHTHLDYPHEYRTKVQNYKFPLIMTLVEEKCILIENLQDKPRIPKFSGILNINGINIREIIKTVLGDISSDGYNTQYKSAAFGSCFQYYYANRYGVPQCYIIEYSDNNSGELKVTTIPALPCSSINYSNMRSSELNYNLIPELSTAILDIDSFSYYGDKNKIFFNFVDNAFREVNKKKIKNVVLDLRGNGGGDPYCSSYLFSYLEKKAAKYFAEPYRHYEKLADPIPLAEKNHFKGNLFILTDGNNFSTSGHLCALLKFHGRGVFIGTETGSTFTCNGAVEGFTLKNTRLFLKISTKSYAVAVEGFKKGRGIIPDHIVNLSTGDLRSGRDGVLEYCKKFINSEMN